MKFPLLGIFLLGWVGLYGQFITNNGVSINNSAQVTVNGEWLITAGTMRNDGTISTNDNFINHGTLDNNSTGRFVLKYHTDHDFKPGGRLFGTLVKEGIGNVLLTGSINIRDSLLLRTGRLKLVNAYDTVCLLSGAAFSADTGSYVTDGLFAREGAGDLVFPLGKEGRYLPLKLYDVQAARVTVSIEAAPLDYTPGVGINTLLDFPYVWRVQESTSQDTAGYVELQFPNTLASGQDLIVARQAPGKIYAGMGARLVEDSGGRITVKSYARKLHGTFTIAQGFPTDLATDSLALVSVYQSTGGADWHNHNNWLSGRIDTWFGITMTSQHITAIELPDNNLAGHIPEPLADILTLEQINLSGNEITALPDFTRNPEITLLDVSGNNLDFGSLEPNATVQGINYLTQEKIGTPLDTTLLAGTAFTLRIPAGGNSSVYRWKRNGELVADTASMDLYVPAIGRANMGEYYVEVTNPKLPGLTLVSMIQKVLAHAHISGMLYADSTTVATRGEVNLYRIRPGGFEILNSVPVTNDGVYEFKNLILDDYQLRGFPDTILYPQALPTYYEQTIIWEEADSISLENSLIDVKIVAISDAGTFTGEGSISGYLQGDDAAGRTREIIPIANAGVSAHLIKHVGTEEELQLAAYEFTNDNGEFLLSGLPTGEYRLNFHYPGYPMDETSFTTVAVGESTGSHVMVEASVVDGKISVRKLAITGVAEIEGSTANIYPNPAADHIRLTFPEDGAVRTIILSDMTGRTVQSINTHSPEVIMKVSEIHEGMYKLQIHKNGVSVKTVKVLIE